MIRSNMWLIMHHHISLNANLTTRQDGKRKKKKNISVSALIDRHAFQTGEKIRPQIDCLLWRPFNPQPIWWKRGCFKDIITANNIPNAMWFYRCRDAIGLFQTRRRQNTSRMRSERSQGRVNIWLWAVVLYYTMYRDIISINNSKTKQGPVSKGWPLTPWTESTMNVRTFLFLCWVLEVYFTFCQT